MGKSTISMAIFHCYVSSPEGISQDQAFPQNCGFQYSNGPTFGGYSTMPGMPPFPESPIFRNFDLAYSKTQKDWTG